MLSVIVLSSQSDLFAWNSRARLLVLIYSLPAKWLVRDVTQEICIGLNIFIFYNAIRAYRFKRDMYIFNLHEICSQQR